MYFQGHTGGRGPEPQVLLGDGLGVVEGVQLRPGDVVELVV